MMYSVGDKVVHPGYGPGVITSIERRQVVGEAKRYYVIDMLTEGGTLMTPVAGADTIGLRPAVSDRVLAKLLASLAEVPSTLSGDFRERQDEVEERLRGSDIFVVAEVLRDLAWHDQAHGLTKRDMQLMQRAQELLAGELALVEEIDLKDAIDRVQTILADAVRKHLEDTALALE
jgi:CarD family transcriptional regulator